MDKNEIENARKLLKNVYKIDSTIETMQKEVDYLENQNLENKKQYISTLKDEIKEMQDVRLQVVNAINKLSDYFGRIIFTRRYILNEEWSDVLPYLGGMCMRNAHYVHKKSLIEFAELLKGI
jgi:NAD(P)H-nitrite reductase large subunit